MAVFPNNILQTVQTYQRSSLGFLQNLCCFVSTFNTKFKDFEKIQTNLGSTVNFDLPPRAVTTAGLVASWQSAVQRLQNLVCSQSANASFAVTAEQRIFNVDKDADSYMEQFGKGFMMELANEVEGDLAKNATSSVVNQQTGAMMVDSGPYRFFGNGSTQLTSYQQLAQAVMLFKNYGAIKDGMKVYLPDTVVPGIVGSGLNQFAPRRNDEIANSWEVGEFGTPPVMYYQSNLLPIHVSGNVGINGTTLTLVSTNDPTGQNVTQITFSGATASDADAIKAGDLIQFNDGVSGKPNMRYLTFIGHKQSANTVQIRATADAAANGGGSVTISITPALNWAGGQNQNLNNALAAGMQVSVTPSHRAGLILGGNAGFLAMPQLPDQDPYPTANEYDKETGVSIRLTHGSLFGQNQTGMIYDCIWGSTVVPEYSMRFVIPLSQG